MSLEFTGSLSLPVAPPGLLHVQHTGKKLRALSLRAFLNTIILFSLASCPALFENLEKYPTKPSNPSEDGLCVLRMETIDAGDDFGRPIRGYLYLDPVDTDWRKLERMHH
jgi:hypothetical protein